jgi:hypothetical protein
VIAAGVLDLRLSLTVAVGVGAAALVALALAAAAWQALSLRTTGEAPRRSRPFPAF